MLINQTTIDKKAMIALAKITRKTLGGSKPVRRFAWFAVVVELIIMIISFLAKDGGWVLNALLAGIMLTCIFGEDTVNGLIAYRQILPDSREVNVTFREDHYIQRSKASETRWNYRPIVAVGEDKDYFALLIDKSHGQIYSKKGFEWGSPEEFRKFIRQKTGLKVKKIK